MFVSDLPALQVGCEWNYSLSIVKLFLIAMFISMLPALQVGCEQKLFLK